MREFLADRVQSHGLIVPMQSKLHLDAEQVPLLWYTVSRYGKTSGEHYLDCRSQQHAARGPSLSRQLNRNTPPYYQPCIPLVLVPLLSQWITRVNTLTMIGTELDISINPSISETVKTRFLKPTGHPQRRT